MVNNQAFCVIPGAGTPYVWAHLVFLRQSGSQEVSFRATRIILPRRTVPYIVFWRRTLRSGHTGRATPVSRKNAP